MAIHYAHAAALLDTSGGSGLLSVVPRYPSQCSLQPLDKILPDFNGLNGAYPKSRQVADFLRPVISAYRSTRNLTFYSTRDIARFFGVSQNTATLAVRNLEKEGFLRRIRGSQTLLLGAQVISRVQIRAVAGLMLWNFAQRFSGTHNGLMQNLAEELWPHNIALEIIPHYDRGDNRMDLNERLRKHSVDFVIWPFPFGHHKEHILHLQDRGVRNLVVGVDGVGSAFEPQILVDFVSSYEKLLRFWKEQHDIRRVIVVEPREFTPRRRLSIFAQMATGMGFDCHVEPNAYTLPAKLLAREKRRIGIALLDEHSTAEFTFYDPPSFVKLARRHRILFGNDGLNVPFVPNGELRVDWIFVPMLHSQRKFMKPLVPAIAKILAAWSSGDFGSPPLQVQTALWTNRELWRYL